MTVYLLDVNVLLALSDPMHVHHNIVHQWFVNTGQEAWATCPITENGLVRIASHPKYPNRPGDSSLVLQILRQLCQAEGHQFWSEDISLRTILPDTTSFTHSQVTDLFLLGLAIHKGGKLATLDRRIPAGVISSGPPAMATILP